MARTHTVITRRIELSLLTPVRLPLSGAEEFKTSAHHCVGALLTPESSALKQLDPSHDGF
jgi:hypothetical protein